MTKDSEQLWEAFVQSMLNSRKQIMVVAEDLLDFPDVAEACRQYADALGRQAAILTEAEKKQAVMIPYWSKMSDLLTRLKLAWRALCGRAIMYRITVPGTFEIDVSQDAHFVGCEFTPSSWQMVVEKKTSNNSD